MYLVIYQVVQFEHIHVSYGNRIVERFSRSAVPELELSGLRIAALFEKADYIILFGAVKYRG